MERAKVFIALFAALLQASSNDKRLSLVVIILGSWLAMIALVGKAALLLAIPLFIIALVVIAEKI